MISDRSENAHALRRNAQGGAHLFHRCRNPMFDLPSILTEDACQALLTTPAGSNRYVVAMMKNNRQAVPRILDSRKRFLQLSMAVAGEVQLVIVFFIVHL